MSSCLVAHALIPWSSRSGFGMYLAGPKGPTEKKDAELIGGLYLVGTRGKYCAVLTERQLTIERFDGKGVRLDLAAIDRMRHLKVPILPSGAMLIGAIAIYLGITTFAWPWNWLAMTTGVMALVANILSRYSILAIETGSGDRHLVSGDEGGLLKLCLLVDRLRHGSTIEESLIGLESLDTELPIFPALRDAKGLLNAPREKNPEVVGAGSETTATHAVQENSVKANEMGLNNLETPINVQLEVPLTVEESTQTRIDQHGDLNSESIGAYERAWGGRKSPSWYVEKETQIAGESRIDSALSDAAQGLDLFANGGIFDADVPSVSTVESDISASYDVEGFVGAPSQPLPRPSSAQMIKNAHGRFGVPDAPYNSPMLPPPTEEAVREECKAGVVRQAKARQELRVRDSIERLYQPANLEEYPALNKLASSMGANRISNSSRGGKGFSSGWLGRLLRPTSGVPRAYEAPILGNKEASEGWSKSPPRFQTSQHMRLRSDQDHQAEVGVRIRSMQTVKGVSSAKDALDSIVTRLSTEEELGPRMLDLPTETLCFNELKPTSSKEDPHPLPGVRRLG